MLSENFSPERIKQISSGRLSRFRSDHSLTQRQVAEHLPVSEEAYSFYEYGSSRIPFETLQPLAALFGTSADYILGLTDDPVI